MEKNLHPNYQKASRLMFLSGGIYILQEVYTKDMMNVHSDYGLGVLIAGVVTFGIALLVRHGHNWIKYLMLVCMVLSLFMIKPFAEQVNQAPVAAVAMVITTLLQLWAMILLFMIPKRVSAVAE